MYSSKSSSRQILVNLARVMCCSFLTFFNALIRLRARSLIYNVAVFCDMLSRNMLLMLLFAMNSRDW